MPLPPPSTREWIIIGRRYFLASSGMFLRPFPTASVARAYTHTRIHIYNENPVAFKQRRIPGHSLIRARIPRYRPSRHAVQSARRQIYNILHASGIFAETQVLPLVSSRLVSSRFAAFFLREKTPTQRSHVRGLTNAPMSRRQVLLLYIRLLAVIPSLSSNRIV